MFIAITAWGAEPQPDAAAIMKKVAVETDAASEARRRYVYHQRVRSSLLKGNNQLLCRESREYDVIPHEKATEKKLVAFSGECLEGKKMVPYSRPDTVRPGLRQKATGDDGDTQTGERESVASVINDLVNDRKSRDGIPRQLIPLSSDEIANYAFSLKGETTINRRLAWDIKFEPVDQGHICIDAGDEDSKAKAHVDLRANHDHQESPCRPWKGEVWIDEEDFQPVKIDTQLAKGIPWGFRVFMGINVGQLGFSLTYHRVAPRVWFPATYGTEFYVKAFWIKRTITLSMENTDFRKTDAQSTVHFDAPQ